MHTMNREYGLELEYVGWLGEKNIRGRLVDGMILWSSLKMKIILIRYLMV